MTDHTKSNKGINNFNKNVSVSAEIVSRIHETIICFMYISLENSALTFLPFIISEDFMQLIAVKIIVKIDIIFPGKNTNKLYSNPLSI